MPLYRYTIEFQTNEALTEMQAHELRDHMLVQVESIEDGTIATVEVTKPKWRISAFTLSDGSKRLSAQFAVELDDIKAKLAAFPRGD